jgi:magnesium chelatase family protein
MAKLLGLQVVYGQMGQPSPYRRALPDILPQMSIDEVLDVTHIYPVADQLPQDIPSVRNRTFRSLRYTISHAGLVGGGIWPHPGEISLARTEHLAG